MSRAAAPSVSALMIVRDGQRHLGAAVASVLGQDLEALELLVVDDGSQDSTWEVAVALAAADARVRVIANERSPGIPGARNTGLAAARGEFVAICDADDLSRPSRFSRQLARFTADPDIVGLGAQVNRFREQPSDGRVPGWHWGLAGGRPPFPFPTAMFRARALRASGGFDERFAVAEDLELAYRLAGAGAKLVMLPEILVDYRASGQGAGTVHPNLAASTLRAQLAGVRHLRGRLSPRGYAVIARSGWRTLRERQRNRFSNATAR